MWLRPGVCQVGVASDSCNACVFPVVKGGASSDTSVPSSPPSWEDEEGKGMITFEDRMFRVVSVVADTGESPEQLKQKYSNMVQSYNSSPSSSSPSKCIPNINESV